MVYVKILLRFLASAWSPEEHMEGITYPTVDSTFFGGPNDANLFSV